ncbi:MAG: pyridoxine 5'-phosphate synthase [Deltaproteobacteria bacterium]|nr:pyridoxine 5'-phosphate synthase [Deltaproteobacteria bacterium]
MVIEEYSIGHSIMARAIYMGMDQAVREMIGLVRAVVAGDLIRNTVRRWAFGVIV